MGITKTAISIEQSLFDEVGALAKELVIPRSQLFALAIKDYLKTYRNKQMLAQLNRAYADQADDPIIQKTRSSHRKQVMGEW